MPNEVAPRVDRIFVLEVAAEAKADPRSVEKRLKGHRVRGMPGDRIERVLERRGFTSAELRAE